MVRDGFCGPHRGVSRDTQKRFLPSFIQKAKRGSDFSEPLWVPGTEHVDSAKSMEGEIGSWWIVKEMPLDDPRPRRKSNERGNVTLT